MRGVPSALNVDPIRDAESSETKCAAQNRNAQYVASFEWKHHSPFRSADWEVTRDGSDSSDSERSHVDRLCAGPQHSFAESAGEESFESVTSSSPTRLTGFENLSSRKKRVSLLPAADCTSLWPEDRAFCEGILLS